MIQIMDNNFRIIDILRKYTFSQYEQYFRNIGTFTLYVRNENENKYLLNRNEQYYVLFERDVIGKIESVKKDSDSEYENILEIKGRLAPVIFTQRVITGTVTFKGRPDEYIRTLIEKEMVMDDMWDNRYVGMEIVSNIPQESELTEVDKQITGGYVWDEIKEVMEMDKLGFYFYPVIVPAYSREDEKETNVRGWHFLMEEGTDRRKINRDNVTPIVFSQSLSNIDRTTYEKNVEKFKNVAYVAGEGEGDKRKWYEEKINQKNNIESSGWDRNELWVDARDIQSEQENKTLTTDEYEAQIRKRADEKAEENNVSESYDCTITEVNKRYVYEKDYRLGDWVTVEDEELNITVDAQITKVTVSEQDNREIIDITLTYGSKPKGNKEQLDENTTKIENAETNIKYLEQLTKTNGKIATRDAESGILYRIGNIVHFHHQLNVTVLTKALGWQTIPEGYRPITVERHSFISINSWNHDARMTVWVDKNGSCGYISDKSVFTEFWFDMYYFTNDKFPTDDII